MPPQTTIAASRLSRIPAQGHHEVDARVARAVGLDGRRRAATRSPDEREGRSRAQPEPLVCAGRPARSPSTISAIPDDHERAVAVQARLGVGEERRSDHRRHRDQPERAQGAAAEPSIDGGGWSRNFTSHTVDRSSRAFMGARVEPSPPTGGDASSTRAPMTRRPAETDAFEHDDGFTRTPSGSAAPPQELRGADRPRRRGPHRGPRRGARAARTQRRRQDDDGGDPRRPPQGRRRPASRCSATTPASASAASASASGSCSRKPGWTRRSRWREAIELYGAAYPSPRPAHELLELVGLERSRRRTAPPTSPAASAAAWTSRSALVGDPDLIFLDEPTTGFDPAARRQSWETISSLRALGKSILLTTHYMEEAQYLADRVVVLAKGRIVAEGTPDELGSGRRDLDRHRSAGRRSTTGSRCPTTRDRRARARAASARPRRPRDLAPLLELGRHARHGARAPDRHASDPRGRLSRSHRYRGGGRATAITTLSSADAGGSPAACG